MAKSRLSIPVERRKAQLRNAIMDSKIKIAEQKERQIRARDELSQLKPKPKSDSAP